MAFATKKINSSPNQQEAKREGWQVPLEAHVLPFTGLQVTSPCQLHPLDGTSDSELINGKETPGGFLPEGKLVLNHFTCPLLTDSPHPFRDSGDS